MRWVLLAVLLLAAVAILLWVGARIPYRHRHLSYVKLVSLLQVLLHQGLEGGFLIIKTKSGGQFIQFRKYMHGKGDVGIICSFPKADWSLDYYEKFRRKITNSNFDYEIELTGVAGVAEFIVIDFGKDVERAATLAELALRDVLEVDPEKDCLAYFSDVSTDSKARIGF